MIIIIKKNLSIFLVFLSLLFNIQAGFTNDVEHLNHDHEHEQGSLIDCEDCSLKHHLDKTVKLSNTYNFDYLNHTNLNDNYLISNNIVYTFVAYQSRAP
jgi:hypothetical protein